MAERVIRRILAPVALSEPEIPDMGYAISVAAQLGAELVLFACLDTPSMVALVGRHRAAGERDKSFDDSLVEEAKNILAKFVDAANSRGVDALGHATVNEHVEEQILKEALVQKVDLMT
jgi:nucleotide-binding universal stress UspA family protein